MSEATMCEMFQHFSWMKFGEILHWVAEVDPIVIECHDQD